MDEVRLAECAMHFSSSLLKKAFKCSTSCLFYAHSELVFTNALAGEYLHLFKGLLSELRPSEAFFES